jgi:hypothetical protein
LQKNLIDIFIVILVMSKLVQNNALFLIGLKIAGNSMCAKQPTLHHGVSGSNPAWVHEVRGSNPGYAP